MDLFTFLLKQAPYIFIGIECVFTERFIVMNDA